jgi:hypothetical protein
MTRERCETLLSSQGFTQRILRWLERIHPIAWRRVSFRKPYCLTIFAGSLAEDPALVGNPTVFAGSLAEDPALVRTGTPDGAVQGSFQETLRGQDSAYFNASFKGTLMLSVFFRRPLPTQTCPMW